MRQRKPGIPPTALRPARRSGMKPPPVSRPKAPPSGTPPNPRRARVVKTVGGPLNDLFEMFPDLPRAATPPARVWARRNPRLAWRRR